MNLIDLYQVINNLPEDRRAQAHQLVADLVLAGVKITVPARRIPGNLNGEATPEAIGEVAAKLVARGDELTFANIIEALGGVKTSPDDKKKVIGPIKAGLVPGLRFQKPVSGQLLLT